MNVNFKYPGSDHDARVFRKSCIYKQGQTGRLCPPNPCEVGGTTVLVVILGDSAYPLLTWSIKPFSDSHKREESLQLSSQPGTDGGGERLLETKGEVEDTNEEK